MTTIPVFTQAKLNPLIRAYNHAIHNGHNEVEIDGFKLSRYHANMMIDYLQNEAEHQGKWNQ